MSEDDVMNEFEQYECEATFTGGNKMTTSVVAMDDIRIIVQDLIEKRVID